MDWQVIYEDLKTKSWIVLLILASASHFILSPARTLGTITGGLLIIANFQVFQHTIRKAFSSDARLKSGKIAIIAKYYLRLLFLGIIIYVLMGKGWVDPVGLAIGLSTVVISISILGISLAIKVLTGEAC
jgi:hypothetical protein